MSDDKGTNPSHALDYASPASPTNSPTLQYKLIVAALLSVAAVIVGIFFFVLSICVAIAASAVIASPRWNDEDTACVSLLLCSVIAIVPGIYYGRAALRGLKRGSRQPMKWADFIRVSTKTGRTVEEIDRSIRELRDERPQ
jgi:uncharacterized membrane protein YbhN (UPF0104 family)